MYNIQVTFCKVCKTLNQKSPEAKIELEDLQTSSFSWVRSYALGILW